MLSNLLTYMVFFHLAENISIVPLLLFFNFPSLDDWLYSTLVLGFLPSHFIYFIFFSIPQLLFDYCWNKMSSSRCSVNTPFLAIISQDKYKSFSFLLKVSVTNVVVSLCPVPGHLVPCPRDPVPFLICLVLVFHHIYFLCCFVSWCFSW